MNTHERFAAKLHLPFPLLSDSERKVMAAYGVIKEKSMYGRTFLGMERMTFLVDKAGIIRKIWQKVKVAGHAAEVLGSAKQL
jgi:peroxiredoxin Q/BCP